VSLSPREPIFASWLDLRADKIDDPVKRLRFLRRGMQALESEVLAPAAPMADSAPHRRLTGKWPSVVGLAIAAILGAAWPAGVAETAVRERRMAIPAGTVAFEVPKDPIRVWRVDKSETLETYSNGLRVDLTFAEANKPRQPYPVFPLSGGAQPARYQPNPAGIVYHTTESHLAEFEEADNGRLKALARNLLEVVRDEHAYHYVIDRFGRVYRVVEETDIANHAGHSIWADPSGIYVNLNSSFLAVSFEGQTGEPSAVTAAQVQAARMLTEMLRSKYSIPAENCVTHAQVSVSGVNNHIGAHTDWASQFPFAAVGLPDNYAQPLPSLMAFGFEYDSAFVGATGGRWKGLDLAEAQVAHQAAAQGMTVTRYRAILQHRYTDILGVVAEFEGGS
jgi:hypothetical protein